MTRRVLAGGLLFAATMAGAASCGSGSAGSSEKTGTSGVADPANGCVRVADASAGGYATFEDLPSGSCGGELTTSCQSLVGTACCGTVNLALYDCSCAGGTWSCTLASSEDTCGPCAMDPPDADADAGG